MDGKTFRRRLQEVGPDAGGADLPGHHVQRHPLAGG